jgi:hypothetical protein
MDASTLYAKVLSNVLAAASTLQNAGSLCSLTNEQIGELLDAVQEVNSDLTNYLRDRVVAS